MCQGKAVKKEMKVKTKKNEYGWISINCPFCEYHTRESMGDKLRWVKNHILKMAKNEALELYIDRGIANHLHLDYVKEHTSSQKVISTATRVFDQDLKI